MKTQVIILTVLGVILGAAGKDRVSSENKVEGELKDMFVETNSIDQHIRANLDFDRKKKPGKKPGSKGPGRFNGKDFQEFQDKNYLDLKDEISNLSCSNLEDFQNSDEQECGWYKMFSCAKEGYNAFQKCKQECSKQTDRPSCIFGCIEKIVDEVTKCKPCITRIMAKICCWVNFKWCCVSTNEEFEAVSAMYGPTAISGCVSKKSDKKRINKLQDFTKFKLDCPANHALNSFVLNKLSRSDKGKYRYHYLCCELNYEAASLEETNPTIFNPNSVNVTEFTLQKVFCPAPNAVIKGYQLKSELSANTILYKVQCAQRPTNPTCIKKESTAKGGATITSLSGITIHCPKSNLPPNYPYLQDFQLKYVNESILYDYNCCN